jgi:sulfonate transport system permease protein
MTDRPRRSLTGLAVPTAALAMWQLCASMGLLRYEYLPAPVDVAMAFAQMFRSGELVDDVFHTLLVSLIAATSAVALGAVIGLAVGLQPILRRYSVASIDFLRAIPAVALVPVAVMTLGPFVMTEVILAFYAALWPVVLCTAGGAAATHPRQYDVAKMLHFSPMTTLRKVVVPAAVPEWLVGARLAAVIALLVAIVTEMIMYHHGLGGGLVRSLNALAPARVWAYALFCGVIGFALNALLGRAVTDLPASLDSVVVQPATSPRGLLPVVVGLAAWELVAAADSVFLPPPSEWFKALRRIHVLGTLTPALVQTVSTYAFGLAFAVVMGGVSGVAIGASRRVDATLSPSIAFLAAVPGAAVVPAAVLLLGPGQLSGVVIVALITSWPVLLAAAAATRAIPVVRLEMSRTLGLAPSRRWTRVVLPSLVPGFLLGVRVASAVALVVTLLVDVFGVGAGLGRLLIESQQRFESATAWGLVVVIGAFGYMTSSLFVWLDRAFHVQRDRTRPNWSSQSI